MSKNVLPVFSSGRSLIYFEFIFAYGVKNVLGFSGSTNGKNLPANAGEIKDAGSITGLGRSPGGGNGNPFQCSCLENPKDRGAWQAKVHWVANNQTLLSN